VIFRGAKIDLATLSNYNLHLLPNEVERIRDYIELPKFRAWLYKDGKVDRMTPELLGQCQQLETGDIFHYLGWPTDILALRLPSHADNPTLQDVIFPKLLAKVARVINKTREEATSVGDANAKHGALTGRDQRVFMWILLPVTGVIVVLVIWLGNSHSWILEDAADTASRLFARIQASINRLLSDMRAYLNHMYMNMTESTEEGSFKGAEGG